MVQTFFNTRVDTKMGKMWRGHKLKETLKHDGGNL